jgi:hypothetical protein
MDFLEVRNLSHTFSQTHTFDINVSTHLAINKIVKGKIKTAAYYIWYSLNWGWFTVGRANTRVRKARVYAFISADNYRSNIQSCQYSTPCQNIKVLVNQSRW